MDKIVLDQLQQLIIEQQTMAAILSEKARKNYELWEELTKNPITLKSSSGLKKRIRISRRKKIMVQ